MIYLIFGALFVCALIILLVFYILFRQNKTKNLKKRDNLLKLISQKDFDYLLIDIRDSSQYQRFHIPTAVNIPYRELSEIFPVENMFMKIIIYGDNNSKSKKSAETLSMRGYFNVESFGSIDYWKGEVINKDYIGDSYIENSKNGRFDFSI